MSATGTAIRPFVVKDMVSMIMQKKRLSFVDASCYLYSSELYAKILDDETKMWYLSTPALYDILEEEKRNKRHHPLPDKLLMFRSFCIESYSDYKQQSSLNTISLFKQYEVFAFLDDTFEMLHTQDPAYIIDSIEKYIKSQRRVK